MSISAAISNAVSGLTATSRGTEIVSTNIANSQTEGYGRRELELSSRIYERGGGVAIDGINRSVNAGILADSRLALAQLGSSDTKAQFHIAMENEIGNATQASSLDALLAAFSSALTNATARPDSDVRLSAVLDTASALAGKINNIADNVQRARSDAERTIANDVARLNSALERVTALNKQIAGLMAQGKDASSQMDARQAAVSSISDIVPLKQISRDNGQIALFTTGGAILLDGPKPATIEFTKAGPIQPDMSLSGGTLANLVFNGKELTTSQQAELFSGGSLSANFFLRDEEAPAYQSQIDAIARDLYDRVSDPSVDASLATGDAGLFTDNQSAFAAANEAGFANRIAVNSVIDPAAGGQLWHIRAGINAAGPGDSGESGLLNNLGTALSDTRLPVSPNLTASSRSFYALTSELSSYSASNRVRSEATALQNRSQSESMRTALLADGVDTDKEMETLLALERAYAANAKVFQSANDMLDTILRLT